jgi:hypothetical protein
MNLNTSLKNVLLLDAATCLSAGTLMAFGSSFVSSLTGIPAPLLFWAGLILFPCAALMAVTARQTFPSRALVWLIVLGNVGWIAASVAVLAIISPNALGYVFILAQAGAVAILALLEYSALQRTGTVSPA